MILFRCDCGKQLKAKVEFAGRKTRCPGCGNLVPIPADEGEGAAGIQPSASPARPPDAPRDEEKVRPTRRRRFEDEDDDGGDGPRRGRPVKKSGLAVTSLVLGLVAVVPCLFFTGLGAILFGILGLRDIGRSGGKKEGKGLALAGMITGGVCVVIWGVVVGLVTSGLILPAFQKVSEAGERLESQNNLKRIAMALHNYHDVNGRFPPAVVYSQDGKPLYSWRVLILPYLEQDGLYRRFRLDEPWDSPNNRPLANEVPADYRMKGRPTTDPTATYYQVIAGRGALFENDPRLLVPMPALPGAKPRKSPPAFTLMNITDGTSNTILVVEAEQAVTWTKPDDVPFDPNGPAPRLGDPAKTQISLAMADGSVITWQRDKGPEMLRALITRAGGEVVDLPIRQHR